MKIILMFVIFFLDYGTSCCSEIRVTLDGTLKRIHSSRAGTYHIASGFVNKRFHWNKIHGDQSIWYNNIHNYWSIGHSTDLGSDIKGLKSIWEEECPASKNRFKYNNGSTWVLPPFDEFTIQCIEENIMNSTL